MFLSEQGLAETLNMLKFSFAVDDKEEFSANIAKGIWKPKGSVLGAKS